MLYYLRNVVSLFLMRTDSVHRASVVLTADLKVIIWLCMEVNCILTSVLQFCLLFVLFCYSQNSYPEM